MCACDCEDDAEQAVEPSELFQDWCRSHGMSRYNEHWKGCRSALRMAYGERVAAALRHEEDMDAANAALDEKHSEVAILRAEIRHHDDQMMMPRTSDVIWSSVGLGVLVIACVGAYLIGMSVEREAHRPLVTSGPAVTTGGSK